MRHELLRLEDLCLYRPDLPPLDHVHLNLFEGEILCVAGLYGSGRRTLAQALSGEIPVDSGRIFLSETQMRPSLHGQRFPGVCHITERLSLLPQLSIAENLSIAHTRRFWIRWKQVFAEAQQVLRHFSLPFDPSLPPAALAFSDRLRLELVKAHLSQASLVAIDPLWGLLGQDELAAVQRLLRQLRAEGLSFLLMSTPEQIPSLSDRITLLRHGQTIRTLTPQEASSAPVSDWLRDAPLSCPPDRLPAVGHPILETRLPGFRLTLRAGEIAGIWYRRPEPVSHVLETLLGSRPAARGQVFLDGKSYRVRSNEQANRRGVLLIGEMAASRALFDNLSLADNLAVVPRRNTGIGPFMDPRVRRFLTRDICRALKIPFSLHTPLWQLGLSAEQMQSLYLARWDGLPVRLLLCQNPFACMDTVFRERFLRVLFQKAAEGAAVLIFSNNLYNLQFCSTLYQFDERDQLAPFS